MSTMPGNKRAIRFYRRHGLVDQAVLLEKHLAHKRHLDRARIPVVDGIPTTYNPREACDHPNASYWRSGVCGTNTSQEEDKGYESARRKRKELIHGGGGKSQRYQN